jgi:hypothetical protein
MDSADGQVDALCAELWAWRISESPMLATFCGFHQYDDQLDDYSEEAFIKREVQVQSMCYCYLFIYFFIQ